MKFSKEIRVGLLAIISIAIFYLGFNYLKGRNFLSTNKTYYAFYQDVKGLIPSNPVVLNGVPVGQVTDVELIPKLGNKILVTIEVRQDLPLGPGTAAVLRSDILSSTAIVLEIQNPDNPLKGNDTLAGTVELALTDQVAQTLEPVVDELDSTVKKVNAFLSSLNNNRGKTDSIFSEVLATTRNLNVLTAVNQTRIANALDGLNKTLNDLNDAQTGIRPLLSKLNMAADTINSLELTETVKNLNSSLAQIDSVLYKAQNGDGSIAKLLNDSTFHDNISSLSYSLDSLVQDFQANPKKYLHISVFGKHE